MNINILLLKFKTELLKVSAFKLTSQKTSKGRETRRDMVFGKVEWPDKMLIKIIVLFCMTEA